MSDQKICFTPPDMCVADPVCLDPGLVDMIGQLDAGNQSMNEALDEAPPQVVPSTTMVLDQVCPVFGETAEEQQAAHDATVDYYESSPDWCYDPKFFGIFNGHTDEDGNEARCYRTTDINATNDDGQWHECCVYDDGHVSYSPDSVSPVEFDQEHDGGVCNYSGVGVLAHGAMDVAPWVAEGVWDKAEGLYDSAEGLYDDASDTFWDGYSTIEESITSGNIDWMLGL